MAWRAQRGRLRPLLGAPRFSHQMSLGVGRWDGGGGVFPGPLPEVGPEN